MFENTFSKNTLELKFIGKITETDFKNFMQLYENILNQNQQFTSIFDMRDVESIPIHLVGDMGSFILKCEPLVKKNLVASAIVVSQEWIIKLIKMLFAIKKPIKPNFITNNYKDAIEFLEDNVFLCKLKKSEEKSKN